MDKRVAVTKCNDYTIADIKKILSCHFSSLGINITGMANKNVVLKPNLVMKLSSEKAATTHPSFVEALSLLLTEAGANVLIAESSGGIYTENTLRSLYHGCGIAEAASLGKAKLNYDTSFKLLHTPDDAVSKNHNILTPIYDADVIFNLAKLKTHSLTKMTAAVKNLFGVVPGVQKFEAHARFKKPTDFMAYLNDLCASLCSAKEIYHIVDAVVGMEGNGPTGGDPRDIGCIITSTNPFSSDLACSVILGFEGTVEMLELAKRRGFCPLSPAELEIIGEKLEDLQINDIAIPDARRGDKFGMIPGFLQPRPVINHNLCVGCSKCRDYCPEKAILIKNNKAVIIQSKCIKCYCCQELCPYKAVKIKRNFLYSLIK